MNRQLKALVAILLLASSCGQSAGKFADSGQSEVRTFPQTKIPSVYSEPSQQSEYLSDHFWDGFFSAGGPCDSSHVLGVSKTEVEQALSNYIALLSSNLRGVTAKDTRVMEASQKRMDGFFTQLENYQKSDTSSLVYVQMTELVQRYLYDPNSPVRDEDLYLPFVKRMASSPCTSESTRKACAFEAKKCSINRFGDVAPDFKFRTLDGKSYSLHGIKADYTMLFFSNPGCTACKGIISEVNGRPYIYDFISNGKLAVVNVYIDAEVDKWREYAHNYPDNWYSGYDYFFTIRDDGRYNVRAIPSLYLLDTEKRVIMKDAPTEKVLAYLDAIAAKK